MIRLKPYPFFLTFFLLFVSSLTIAQNTIKVHGIVIDAKSKLPVLYANIAFPELGIGTATDEIGKFEIENVPAGKYDFSVTYIGYKNYSLNITLKKDVELKIKLQEQSLGLKEVTVTAENSTKGTTSSKINNEAIYHVQASSLKEIMQLVPGNLSENPDLSIPGRIAIREVGTDINSALGTAVVIDGMPMSNDGNLQQSIKAGGFSSVAGTGVDLRQVSVDNIESVTVDVGIPSAEHGNLTSGAVHIKTKSGGSPYHVKIQTDPRTKQFYIGKGYLLSKEMGVVNIDAGYTNSYKHIVKKTDQYKRINTSAKYSKTFKVANSPLIFNAKLGFTNSLDGRKFDPDMLAQEEHRAEDQNLQGKISANWSINKPFITSLSFDAGMSKTWQTGFEKTLESSSSGANYFSTAKEDGEYEVQFGPSTYYSEVNYDGRPLNFYSKVKAKLFKTNGDISNNVLFGLEWRTSGNNGTGRTFNPNKPPTGAGTRPRPFTDIPSLNQFSVFAEDVVNLKIGKTRLNIMAGLRMDNIQPTGLTNTKGSIHIDPRLNLRYDIIDRNSTYIFRNLAIRLGYGQTTKAPTLVHLHPDKSYSDVASFNYYPDLMVTTTKVMHDTRNYDLKASKGKKFEAGIDLRIGKIKSRFTGFYENYSGGFILDHNHFVMHYRDYKQPEAGLNPYYIPSEGVFFKDPTSGEEMAVPFEIDQKYKSFGMYRNARNRIKRGLEYSVDFGKIKALQTSFVLNGAWLKTESYTGDAPYWNVQSYTVFSDNSSKQESFVTKYPNQTAYGIVDERLNTNLNIITHIPEIKMLVTITGQTVWFEKNSRKFYEEYKLYGLNELRNTLNLPNLFSHEHDGEFYYYLPVSYKGYDEIEHDYKISDFTENLAQKAIRKQPSYRFTQRTLPPLFLCNIRISKEISNRFRLSFYANNFLNIRPGVMDERSGRYLRRNQQPYFGADIKMQF